MRYGDNVGNFGRSIASDCILSLFYEHDISERCVHERQQKRSQNILAFWEQSNPS